MDKCAVCYQENGLELKNEYSAGAYYLYPPLWGDDSYNTGAGMYRLIKAASYIKENMPQGAPDLSLEDAYDIAAYMNLQARPIKANRDKDLPDRKVKPLDMDAGSYDDSLSATQHRYEPYTNMIKNNFKAIFIALKIYYFILLNFLTRSSKSCIELIALGLI
ncbi:c-type cytochrome [Campylobacter jejuni]